jgi:hypothetical protein
MIEIYLSPFIDCEKERTQVSQKLMRRNLLIQVPGKSPGRLLL